MGSLTIFGAFEMQALLRTFDILGLALVVLWAFSPLGGQASLRLLDQGVQSALTNTTLKYLSSDSDSIFDEGVSSWESLGFLINTVYLAALLTPPAGQIADMDTWSNVKIPAIETFELAGKPDASGWFEVSADNTSYPSLLGLPIAGISSSGSSTFNVESHYMVVFCPNVSSSESEITAIGGFQANFTRPQGGLEELLPYQLPYPEGKAVNVDFAAGSSTNALAFTAQGFVTRSSVESIIACEGRSCGVTHIRRSIFDQRPANYTPLSVGLNAPSLSNAWPLSSNSIHHPGDSTPTEYFLLDPTLSNLDATVEEGGVNLIGMSAEVFSHRFSLLLNTYWQCSVAPWYRTGNFPSNLSLLNDSNALFGPFFNTTTATVRIDTDIFLCNKTWATILLVAASLLIACGLYGAMVKHRLRGPQVLGYVSTLTRDNPYLHLPDGGCTLDGLERARILKNMKVQFRDVAPDAEVGHIALTHSKNSSRKRLASGRLYAGSMLS